MAEEVPQVFRDALARAEARVKAYGFLLYLNQGSEAGGWLSLKLEAMKRRRDLLNALINSYLNLIADGWPDEDTVLVPGEILKEISGDWQLIEEALREFKLAGASKVTAAVSEERKSR